MTAAGQAGDTVARRTSPGWDAPSPDAGSRHPVNRILVDGAPLPERVADHAVGFLGSWRFMGVQTVIVLIWIVGNAYLWFHFDPYPFILLNLAFSTEAAYAAPLILLAGNRAATRDRMTLEHAAAEADIEDAQNERLLEGNAAILAQVEVLERRILDLERSILDALSDAPRRPVTPSSPHGREQPGA
jgi:uncharacterized membrane protein